MRSRYTYLALVAAALAIAAHGNTLQNPFVFDDRTEVVENASIRDLANTGAVLRHNVTRPLVNLSYAVDYAAWELDQVGYHLTNVLLHTLNVVLLFFLARRFVTDAVRREGGGQGDGVAAVSALVAAGLFAVHPMMTEAVGYVSSRSELLSGSFFLASLLVFRSGMVRRRVGRLAAGAALFLLALGAKETAAMLPPILLVYDWLILRGSRDERRWRLWRVHAPLMTVVLVAAAARVWLYVAVEHAQAPAGAWQNALLNLHVTVRYLSLLIVPASQSIVHNVTPIQSLADPRVATALLVLGSLGFFGIASRRRTPLVTFGIVWFLLLLAPSAALILLAERAQPMAEHRVYLASCGVFLAIATVAARATRLGERPFLYSRDLPASAGLVLALMTLMGLAIARNSVWADPVGLWEDAARKSPLTYVSQYGLADSYRSIGDCEAAAPAYERALRIRPDNTDAYLGLATCLDDISRADDARAVLRYAIARAPADVRSRVVLASLEERRGNRSEALRLCSDALTMAPQTAAALACVERNREPAD